MVEFVVDKSVFDAKKVEALSWALTMSTSLACWRMTTPQSTNRTTSLRVWDVLLKGWCLWVIADLHFHSSIVS